MPHTPTTPSSPSGTRTGTSGAVHRSGSSCLARWESSISTSLGRSATPTRRSSQSGSVGRRSHSWARGPVARSSSSAAFGWSPRRTPRSAVRALKAASSVASRCSSYLRSLSRKSFFWFERPWIWLAIIMIGENTMNMSE